MTWVESETLKTPFLVSIKCLLIAPGCVMLCHLRHRGLSATCPLYSNAQKGSLWNGKECLYVETVYMCKDINTDICKGVYNFYLEE